MMEQTRGESLATSKIPLIPEAAFAEISDFVGNARYPGSIARPEKFAPWIPAYAGMSGDKVSETVQAGASS